MKRLAFYQFPVTATNVFDSAPSSYFVTWSNTTNSLLYSDGSFWLNTQNTSYSPVGYTFSAIVNESGVAYGSKLYIYQDVNVHLNYQINSHANPIGITALSSNFAPVLRRGKTSYLLDAINISGFSSQEGTDYWTAVVNNAGTTNARSNDASGEDRKTVTTSTANPSGCYLTKAAFGSNTQNFKLGNSTTVDYGGFLLCQRFSTTTIATNEQVFVGLSGVSITNTTDITTSTNILGIAKTNTSTNLLIIVNSASTFYSVDTGFLSTDEVIFTMYSPPGYDRILHVHVRRISDNAEFEYQFSPSSVTLPLTDFSMMPMIHIKTVGVSRQFIISNHYGWVN